MGQAKLRGSYEDRVAQARADNYAVEGRKPPVIAGTGRTRSPSIGMLLTTLLLSSDAMINPRKRKRW